MERLNPSIFDIIIYNLLGLKSVHSFLKSFLFEIKINYDFFMNAIIHCHFKCIKTTM